MTTKLDYPMVRVRWVDSSTRPRGWWRIDALTPLADENLDCLTVGLLIDKNKKLLRLAVSITDDGHPTSALDAILVPQCSVVKLEYLTVKVDK